MSFRFDWPSFSDSFYDQAKDLLCSALNKGDKPPIIADRIDVGHLDMGTIPPDLEILEIGDLGTDRFRGIFRLTYAGDASIGLQTKIQANPLRQKTSAASPDILSSPSILFASTPLVVPMNLKLSCLKLRAIVVLVISRLEGVTLVFKNDPLESVEVSSTFDSVSAIQAFVQSEIERQLRELFRTELPGIIHNLSRRWIKAQSNLSSSPSSPAKPLDTTPSSNLNSRPSLFSRPSSIVDSRSRDNSPSPASVPDCVESYDPTYGLRPSHPPLIGNFTRYRSLVAKKARTQGLSAVLESDDDAQDESTPVIPNPPSDSLSPPPPPYSLPRISTSQIDGLDNCDVIHNSLSTPNTPSRLSSKPRILRSQSALLSPNVFGSSSTASSSLAIDSRSNRRVFSSETQLASPLWGPTDEDEDEMLRDRRLERFSNSLLHHSPQSKLNSSQLSIHLAPTTTATNSNSTPTRYGANSSQRSMMTTPYSQSPILTRFTSPITTFQPDKSKKTMMTMMMEGNEDDEIDFNSTESITSDLVVNSSENVNLLASLSRQNWTLSPFTRSITHVAARSTPPMVNHNKKNFKNSERNLKGLNLDGGRNLTGRREGESEVWLQKRVNKIGKKN
ncbi:hypothetical protein DFH28DRAFT_1017048 [Melampsora americana]|nr:hypothetical protein DFH28DRAFT_1017048 [Melampsora americana]